MKRFLPSLILFSPPTPRPLRREQETSLNVPLTQPVNLPNNQIPFLFQPTLSSSSPGYQELIKYSWYWVVGRGSGEWGYDFPSVTLPPLAWWYCLPKDLSPLEWSSARTWSDLLTDQAVSLDLTQKRLHLELSYPLSPVGRRLWVTIATAHRPWPLSQEAVNQNGRGDYVTVCGHPPIFRYELNNSVAKKHMNFHPFPSFAQTGKKQFMFYTSHFPPLNTIHKNHHWCLFRMEFPQSYPKWFLLIASRMKS